MPLHPHLMTMLAGAVALAAAADTTSSPTPFEQHISDGVVSAAQVRDVALATSLGPDGAGKDPRLCPITQIVVPILVMPSWPRPWPYCVPRH